MYTFKELLENYGFKPQSYSGRGMYGKRCVAVVNDSNYFNIYDFICDVYETYDEEEVPENFRHIVSKTKTDDLGLNTIYYWPNEEWS